MRSRSFRFATPRAIFFVAGCGLAVYLVLRLGPSEIVSLLLRIGWGFPLILGIYAGYNLVRAAALSKCISAGERAGYWELLGIRLAGEAVQFLTFTGPFLAEPAKALLLRNRGLRAVNAFGATISEYLVYTFTSATMAIGGLTYLLRNFEVAASVAVAARIVVYVSGAFLLAAAVAIAGRIYLIGAVVRAFKKLPGIGRRIRVTDDDLRATEDRFFAVLRDQPLRFASILGMEFAAQMLLVSELFVLLRSMGEAAPEMYPVVIESATKFISMGFFFIPGQVGASEGVYAVVFTALGLQASAGLTVALVRRLRNLIVSAIGLFLLARLGSGGDRTVQ